MVRLSATCWALALVWLSAAAAAASASAAAAEPRRPAFLFDNLAPSTDHAKAKTSDYDSYDSYYAEPHLACLKQVIALRKACDALLQDCLCAVAAACADSTGREKLRNSCCTPAGCSKVPEHARTQRCCCHSLCLCWQTSIKNCRYTGCPGASPTRPPVNSDCMRHVWGQVEPDAQRFTRNRIAMLPQHLLCFLQLQWPSTSNNAEMNRKIATDASQTPCTSSELSSP